MPTMPQNTPKQTTAILRLTRLRAGEGTLILSLMPCSHRLHELDDRGDIENDHEDAESDGDRGRAAAARLFLLLGRIDEILFHRVAHPANPPSTRPIRTSASSAEKMP